MLSRLLSALHDALNHHATADRSTICDKCGAMFYSLDKMSTLFVNGEKFSFCSLTCVIQFKTTIGEIEQLVHLMDHGASSLGTTDLEKMELTSTA